MPTIASDTIIVYVFRRFGIISQYLMLRKGHSTANVRDWEPFLGDLAEGETAVAAAIREIREKLGLRVISLWALDGVHMNYDAATDRINLSPILAAEVDSEDAQSVTSGADSRWITFKQAMDLIAQPSMREEMNRVHPDVVNADDRGSRYRIPMP